MQRCPPNLAYTVINPRIFFLDVWPCILLCVIIPFNASSRFSPIYASTCIHQGSTSHSRSCKPCTAVHMNVWPAPHWSIASHVLMSSKKWRALISKTKRLRTNCNEHMSFFAQSLNMFLICFFIVSIDLH